MRFRYPDREDLRVQDRRGQAMIEFAIVAVVSVMFMTIMITLLVIALGSFQNNIATESAGRILDEHPVLIEQNFRTHFEADTVDPLANTDDFENVTARQVYRFLNEYELDGNNIAGDGSVLYDESRLILSKVEWANLPTLDLPAINRLLLGQYIFDPDLIVDGQTEQGAYRFPGAVVRNMNTGNLTVLVPLIPGSTAQGISKTFNITNNLDSFYPISQSWVAPVVIGKEADGDGFRFRVIMFHPSQPSALQYDASGLVEADDDTVGGGMDAPPAGYVLTGPQPINPNYESSISRGNYGLGELGIGGGPVGTDGSTPAIPPRKIRPYRRVFETSSVFRIGSPLYVAKYTADENAMPFSPLVDESVLLNQTITDTPVEPFADYEDNNDQSLDFESQVVDRFSDGLKRYFVSLPVDPPVSADNDFVKNVLHLLPNDAGVWKVSVSAEIQVFDDPNDPGDDADEWIGSHKLELRLYKNGIFERLFARQVVSTTMFDPTDPRPTVILQGAVLTPAVVNDLYQVRVYTQRPTVDPLNPSGPAPDYDVQLTGVAETNWVSFERVQD